MQADVWLSPPSPFPSRQCSSPPLHLPLSAATAARQSSPWRPPAARLLTAAPETLHALQGLIPSPSPMQEDVWLSLPSRLPSLPCSSPPPRLLPSAATAAQQSSP